MLSKSLKDKLQGLETPFYLYDMGLLRKTLETASRLAESYGFKIHYAIKANYDARILKTIREYGLEIDCCSWNEIQCALDAGFDPAGIVYAGVGKKDSELRKAVKQGIFAINCESLQELEVLDSIAAEEGRKVRIALRVNPDVDPKTHKCINTGQADSKFGISYEEIQTEATRILAYKNLDIKGMHLHIGSQIRDMRVFETLCEKVNAILDKMVNLGFQLDFVDVGGGLGINYDCPEREIVPDFAGAFEIISKHLKADGRDVHFEYGRALVGQCGELITKVLYNKTTASGKKLAIVDASMTELIRPALYGAHHDIENISSDAKDKETYAVVGTACESTDVFNDKVTLPLTTRGDLLSIKSAGAYGMSMASRYNLHNLPGAVYSDEL